MCFINIFWIIKHQCVDEPSSLINNNFMSRKKSIFLLPFILSVIAAALVVHNALFASAASRKANLGENHALVIGINDYREWPKLKSPVGDAEAMFKTLTEKYNFKKANITLLTDKTKEKPSLVNIITALDKLTGELTDKDNLLVFFSGQSTEDEKGETYWIPIDGKKTTKLTWLNHSDISDAYFASENFKVKNLCILSDSMFSDKLVRTYIVPVDVFNLRYEEKIVERAKRRSREVIAFGDQHWPGDNNTKGRGLFTFYIQKALSENDLDYIDFENLIFDDNIIFPISKIAGVKLLRGRLKTKMAAKGQYVISKTVPLPVVNVVESSVNPTKGYPGDNFLFSVKTDKPAFEAYIEIKGKQFPMKGKGTEWSYTAKFDELGKLTYKAFATNENDTSGKELQGELSVIKKLAEVVNIASVAIKPETGNQGDTFTFTAQTDRPAKEVSVTLNGKPYKMTGSGKLWTLATTIEEAGAIGFAVAAINEDGVPGSTKEGDITIKASPVNIAALTTFPKTGYAGEEFLITVDTDREAKSVTLNLDGVDYPMTGAGKKWQFKKTIDDIGTKSFSVAALNAEGVMGSKKTGEIVTKKSPQPIPDVTTANVSVIAPGKGFAGDRYAVNVKTSFPSEKVYIEIFGKRYPLKGSGTDWRIVAKINRLGETPFKIMAINKDGAQGRTREGKIVTKKRPAIPVNVVKATVSPQKGYTAKPFVFKATTDKPAKNVTLIVGKTRYQMKGEGTQWTLEQKIDRSGKVSFTIAARNQDNKTGQTQKGSFTNYKERFRPNKDGTVTDLLTGKKAERFVNNGDGTVTDRITSLMWLTTPKQIAVNYNEAVEYCKTLAVKNYKGWRLPTIGEFNKLVDKKRQNPALPATHPFENIITHVGYWSKTKHKFGPQYVYQMSMWYGKSNHQKKTESAIVWPVRYADIPEG